jgi:hypothetical protein
MNVVLTLMSGFNRAYDYIITEPLEDKNQRKGSLLLINNIIFINTVLSYF